MSPTSTHRRAAPLPAELTPLLGRDADAARLRELVTTPALRLVTVTGPGGVGKTRLALHVAALEDERPVAFVPLAATRDPDLVLPAILQVFGVFSDIHDIPEDQIVTLLGDQPTLLVLDNLEQLPGASAPLARVLGRCPHLTVLATSQAPLGVSGEQLYPLAPLPTPADDLTSAETILASEAVALFVARARGVNPALVVDDRAAATIAEICRRLDGLPLAIELAAARTAILSPDALLARLANRLQVLGSGRRGVPDRLRTMRSAVAWSYDLLSPDEQALFRRLSVFEGGISLDAIETIFAPCGGRDPFDLLSALVDHSLIQPDQRAAGEPRYLILETLRAYGQEQLVVAGDDGDALLAHATWVTDLAERAEPELTGGEQEAWLNRLDTEVENIRAAVGWSLASGQPELALRIGAAVWRFCSTRGLASECIEWLDRALVLAPNSACRLKALIGSANLLEDQRRLERAEAQFAEARDIAVRDDDPLGRTRALTGLGIVAHDRGDFDAARTLHEQALQAAREAGDPRSIGVASANMAGLAYYSGDLDAAERHWDECLAIATAIRDTSMESITAGNLGALAYERGDLERAEHLQQRALAIQRQMRSSRDLPFTLINLGEVACRLGDYTLSHDCFAEAITLLRQEGITVVEGVALSGVAKLALAQGDPSQAGSLLLESTRMVHEGGDKLTLVENADVLAAVCVERGRHADAVELLGAADRNRHELDTAATPQKTAQLEHLEAATRAALGGRAWERAWEAGRELDLEAMTRRVVTIAREIVGRRQPAIETATEPDGPAVDHDLTARELQVLRLLAQGMSTQEVSDAMSISPRTTATHVTNILGKLGVESRTAAVAWALRAGLA